MLIELGPRVLLRGEHWYVGIRNAMRVVLPTVPRVVWDIPFDRYCRMCDVAARSVGFAVDEYGYITNWYDVPHLWEQSCAGS